MARLAVEEDVKVLFTVNVLAKGSLGSNISKEVLALYS